MRAVVVLLAAASTFAACGDRPRDAAGGIPDAVLTRVDEDARRRESEGDPAAGALRRAVDDVRAGRAPRESPSRQTVLTAWMTEAIVAGRIEEAGEAHRVLIAEHDGEARYPDGSTGTRAAVAAGLLEAAAREARRRAEGETPDRAASATAFAVADDVRGGGIDDPEALAALESARRWSALDGLASLGSLVASHEGSRVVVFADDFALGEPVLLSVLTRWAQEGAAANLRVGVVPVLGGHVRRGIRREPATPEEEAKSIDARLEGTGVLREPGSLRPSEAERLGLPPLTPGVVVLDRTGRVVARLSGSTLDPRPLEPVVQRVASR